MPIIFKRFGHTLWVNKSVFSYADNVALPAFARHTPGCCAPCSNRSISSTDRATAAKFAAAYINPAAHTVRAMPTSSSAIAEGPRDASYQMKSCQLPRNSAGTIYTTSPDQIDGMKLEI